MAALDSVAPPTGPDGLGLAFDSTGIAQPNGVSAVSPNPIAQLAEEHDQPYLYVGPWAEAPKGELWNGTAFGGAELTYEDLLASEDQVGDAVEFFELRLRELTA